MWLYVNDSSTKCKPHALHQSYHNFLPQFIICILFYQRLLVEAKLCFQLWNSISTPEYYDYTVRPF